MRTGLLGSVAESKFPTAQESVYDIVKGESGSGVLEYCGFGHGQWTVAGRGRILELATRISFSLKLNT